MRHIARIRKIKAAIAKKKREVVEESPLDTRVYLKGSETFPRGKYSGRSVLAIAVRDSEYIFWCSLNAQWRFCNKTYKVAYNNLNHNRLPKFVKQALKELGMKYE